MGRVRNNVVGSIICGGSSTSCHRPLSPYSYEKFDAGEGRVPGPTESGGHRNSKGRPGADPADLLSYSCSACGHHGALKVDELANRLEQQNNVLNNMECSIHHKVSNPATKQNLPTKLQQQHPMSGEGNRILGSCLVLNDLHGKGSLQPQGATSVHQEVAHACKLDHVLRKGLQQLMTFTERLAATVVGQDSSTRFDEDDADDESPLMVPPALSTKSSYSCKNKSSRASRKRGGVSIDEPSSSARIDGALGGKDCCDNDGPVVGRSGLHDLSGCWAKISRSEEVNLRGVPWYQPGLSREIATEILSSRENQLQLGSFLVRCSASHSDNLALSVRVSDTGSVSHYLLITSLALGFKIKGSEKSFPSLESLIVHHSVMKEVLPCPLFLGRGPKKIRQCRQQLSSMVQPASTPSTCLNRADRHEGLDSNLASKPSLEQQFDESYIQPEVLLALQKALLKPDREVLLEDDDDDDDNFEASIGLNKDGMQDGISRSSVSSSCTDLSVD